MNYLTSNPSKICLTIVLSKSCEFGQGVDFQLYSHKIFSQLSKCDPFMVL